MASQLSLYNDVCLLCGERSLASLTEEVEIRRLLDQVWNTNLIEECLGEGLWHFALRSQQLDYDPQEAPAWGYTYAFSKPDDWLQTAAICYDEFFYTPIVDFAFEGGFWYCDATPIYVRYVSNDSGFGMNIGDWPTKFKNYVAATFAMKVMIPLGLSDDRKAEIREEFKRAKNDSRNADMMAQPPTDMPEQSWQRARRNGRSLNDRGKRSTLTG